MDNAKKMRWTLPEGGSVSLEWPESISLESLEMVKEVLALQLSSVRRAIERKKAAVVAQDASAAKSPVGDAQ
jgi:hypothetical protein